MRKGIHGVVVCELEARQRRGSSRSHRCSPIVMSLLMSDVGMSWTERTIRAMSTRIVVVIANDDDVCAVVLAVMGTFCRAVVGRGLADRRRCRTACKRRAYTENFNGTLLNFKFTDKNSLLIRIMMKSEKRRNGKLGLVRWRLK